MKKLLFTCLILWAASLFSQELKTTQDLGAWIGTTAQFKLSKKYSLNFSQEIRLFNNSQKLEKYISELGLRYQINKEFSLGSDLRYFINRQSNLVLTQDWRYNFDFRYKAKGGFGYRLRYQTAYEEPFGKGMNQGGITSNFRNAFSYEKKLNKKNILKIRGEIFRQIKSYRKPYFNKFRLSLEDQIKTKIGKFNVALNYERELNSTNPLNFFFLSIHHKFKVKKK